MVCDSPRAAWRLVDRAAHLARFIRHLQTVLRCGRAFFQHPWEGLEDLGGYLLCRAPVLHDVQVGMGIEGPALSHEGLQTSGWIVGLE